MTRSELRLLHVAPFAADGPNFGGIPLSVRLTCDALQERGHSVTVWASDLGAKQGSNTEKTDTGVLIRYFPAKWKTIGSMINSPIVPKIMMAGANKLSGFDLVHMHGYWNVFAPTLARAASTAGVPFIVQPRGSLSKYAVRGFAKRVFDLLFRRLVVDATTLAVALTPSEKQDIVARGFLESLVEVVPNFVTPPSFMLPSRNEARRKLNLPLNQPVVLYLGRLHATKGIERLISSFADVKAILPSSILVIAGPDEGRREDLIKLSKSLSLTEVKFPGPFDPVTKWLALRAADVLCLPSHSEGFPRALLESMVAETPVVLSNQVRLQFVVEEGAILTVSPEPTLLGECLVKVLSDADLRSDLVRNAQTTLERHFSKRMVLEHLEGAYARAISINQRRANRQMQRNLGRFGDFARS